MPYPFTHLALASTVWPKHWKKIRMHLFFFGALLPDIDIVLFWLLGFPWHRTITHSIFFVGFIAGLSWIFFRLMKERGMTLPLVWGVIVHLFLDVLQLPGIQLFWPYPIWVSSQGVQFLQVHQLGVLGAVTPAQIVFDLVVGAVWLLYIYRLESA